MVSEEVMAEGPGMYRSIIYWSFPSVFVFLKAPCTPVCMIKT